MNMIKKNASALSNVFRNRCREHHLKMTPQRLVIYEELLQSKDHPSADAIFKRVRRSFPNISFDTVNRTLLTFSRIGFIRVVEGHGDPKRFDPQLSNHHHFRCMQCNRIIDFYNESYDRMKIPEEFKKQYNVLNKKVVLEGICDRCQKRK